VKQNVQNMLELNSNIPRKP